MKKGLLILICCAFFTSIQAQLDREKVYGKWTGIGIKTSGLLISLDDIPKSLETFYQATLEKDSSHVFTAEDSTRFIVAIAEIIGGLDKCYIQFDKNGKVKAMLDFGEKSGKTIKGTWKWIDNDKIQMEGEAGYLLVLKLTDDRLSFMPVTDPDKKNAEQVEMQFAKKK